MRKLLVAAIFSLFMITGCATNSPFVHQQGISPVDNSLPPVSNLADDMGDIEIPAELEWDRDDSMSIKTESFNGGILKYSGRVDIISLKDFLISSMQNNKWKLVGEITSDNMVLAFTKPSKTCLMVLSDPFGKIGKTHVTLYVTVDKTAAAKPNPFGEAVSK